MMKILKLGSKWLLLSVWLLRDVEKRWILVEMTNEMKEGLLGNDEDFEAWVDVAVVEC
jgi:hypothetical protein